VTEEAVDNPYGLKALWGQGDIVAKGTLVIMLIMSMGSWYVIFTKLFEQRRMLKSAGKKAADTFWKAGSVKPGITGLAEGSAFRYIAEAASRPATTTKAPWSSSIDKHTWVSMSSTAPSSSVQSRLQDGLAVLATVGSTAPFVGLFGTVWGIYNALVKIGISGQASIDKVAGPVGEALIMTAIGLAVAVPAVMGYNWLIRRNKA
jgi:biopolymer transport protein ExbB